MAEKVPAGVSIALADMSGRADPSNDRFPEGLTRDAECLLLAACYL